MPTNTNVYNEKKKKNQTKTKRTFLLIIGSNLSQVAEVISFHFQIEDFALCFFGFGNKIRIQKFLSKKEKTQIHLI